MKKRREGDWIIYESDDGTMQARIRDDTKFEFEQVWGKQELLDQIENAFSQWTEMRRQAEADAKRKSN
jgi:hypothetical protein